MTKQFKIVAILLLVVLGVSGLNAQVNCPSNKHTIGRDEFGGSQERCPPFSVMLCPAVTSIGNGAFQECASLISVSFPNATSIGLGAFASCKNLADANFPNVASIGLGAFMNCGNLENAYFPNAKSIGGFAFSNAGKLILTLGPEPPELEGPNVFFISTLSNITIRVPFGSKENYLNHNNWKPLFKQNGFNIEELSADAD